MNKKYTNNLLNYLESQQYQKIKEMNIQPPRVYSYDEQVRQEIIFFASQSVQETDDYHWLFLLT